MNKQYTLPAAAGRLSRTRKNPTRDSDEILDSSITDPDRSVATAGPRAAPGGEPARALIPASEPTEGEPQESDSMSTNAGGENDRAPVEWGSHAAYGIGALVLVAPMLIPGAPMMTVFLAYLGGGAVILMGACAWGVIRALAGGRRPREQRRRSWPG